MPTVPPHASAAIPFDLLPVAPGAEFSAQSTLYFDWRGRLVERKVTVRGTTAK